MQRKAQFLEVEIVKTSSKHYFLSGISAQPVVATGLSESLLPCKVLHCEKSVSAPSPPAMICGRSL